MTADSTASKALDFIVKKDDLRTCKFVPANGPDQTVLQPGQVILKVDKFAFTSNNVTYAAFGDVMSYWNFFPAQDGWGRIRVWGFADVVRSEHESIKVGERVRLLRRRAASPGFASALQPVSAHHHGPRLRRRARG